MTNQHVPPGLSESEWRALVKPLFLAMHKHSLRRVVIDRDGTMADVKFFLEPSDSRQDESEDCENCGVRPRVPCEEMCEHCLKEEYL